jgi:hypothetical protein
MSFWQSLRPHFLCRYSDRKFARSPPKPIASVVSSKPWKKKINETIDKKRESFEKEFCEYFEYHLTQI